MRYNKTHHYILEHKTKYINIKKQEVLSYITNNIYIFSYKLGIITNLISK